MSDECEAAGKLFAAVAEDGAVVFGDDPATVPDAGAAVDARRDVLRRQSRRRRRRRLDDSKETETKEVAVKEPTDSAAERA